ncbi:MAG: hypothetical protein GXZ01_00600 [Clostridiaceae bacterium]|nr:hypothetical protein [Clostridiaceae bacterium]
MLKTAYSIFEPGRLEPEYRSDNEFDFAPDIVGLFCEHYDELSDETREYIANKIMLSDIRLHTDASMNQGNKNQGWFPFVTHAYADGYDVTVLDKAYLSPGGKFIFWYTETGDSAVDEDTIHHLAGVVESITEDIEDFLDI